MELSTEVVNEKQENGQLIEKLREENEEYRELYEAARLQLKDIVIYRQKALECDKLKTQNA